MNMLPVDRALKIYSALAGPLREKGARERLSKHLLKKYIEGEKDEHRLTAEGLSYLRNLDREIDSRNSLSPFRASRCFRKELRRVIRAFAARTASVQAAFSSDRSTLMFLWAY